MHILTGTAYSLYRVCTCTTTRKYKQTASNKSLKRGIKFNPMLFASNKMDMKIRLLEHMKICKIKTFFKINTTGIISFEVTGDSWLIPCICILIIHRCLFGYLYHDRLLPFGSYDKPHSLQCTSKRCIE